MKLTTAQALILFGLLTEKIKTLNSIGDTLHSKVMHEDRKYYIKLRDEIIQANGDLITIGNSIYQISGLDEAIMKLEASQLPDKGIDKKIKILMDAKKNH